MGEEAEKRLECSSKALQDSRWVPRRDISLVKMYLFTMLNTHSHTISSLSRHVLCNPRVLSANWIMQSGVESSSVLLWKLYILEDTRRLSHSLTSWITCGYAYLKLPSMSPLLFVVPGVSVFEVKLLDFKSAPCVLGIKDRILNLFDHEKSAYIQVDSPYTLTILHYSM